MGSCSTTHWTAAVLAVLLSSICVVRAATIFSVNVATLPVIDLALVPTSTEALLWSNASSWVGGRVPSANDTVIIDTTSTECTYFFQIDVNTPLVASLVVQSIASPPCLSRVFVAPGIVVNARQVDIGVDTSITLLRANMNGDLLNISGQLTGQGALNFAKTTLNDGSVLVPGLYSHFRIQHCVSGWPGLWTWASILTNTTYRTSAIRNGDLTFDGTTEVGSVSFYIKSLTSLLTPTVIDVVDFPGRTQVGNITDVVLFNSLSVMGVVRLQLMTNYETNVSSPFVQWQRISLVGNGTFSFVTNFGSLNAPDNCPGKGAPTYNLDKALCNVQKIISTCTNRDQCQGPRCFAGTGSKPTPVFCGTPLASQSGAGGLSVLLAATPQTTCSSSFGCNPSCLNGGTCLSAIGACSCSINYTGNACQTLAFAATSSDTGNTGSGSSSGGGSTTTSQLPATDAPVSLALIIGLAVGIPCAVLIGAGIAVLVYVLHKKEVSKRTAISMAKISTRVVD